MAKQSQKSKDKNMEILQEINKYTQIKKRVEMFRKKKNLKITVKIF